MELSRDGKTGHLRGMRATILEAHRGGWCQACSLPSLTYGWAVVEPRVGGWYLTGASECERCGTRVVA